MCWRPSTSDRAGALPGRVLPMRVARHLMGISARQLRRIGGGNPRSTCRRFNTRRIDCSEGDFGICQGITSLQLRADGILAGRDYSKGTSRCRFRARPRWQGRRYGIELPAR